MSAYEENVAKNAGLGRVLLVDDEPELRRVFRRSLARGGFDVTEAGDGATALELSRQRDFEVVISDVCMPKMTGLVLLDRLLLEVPQVPVVLVSGSTAFMDVASALECGAFDFLQKPVSLGELRARVSKGIDEHRRRISAVDRGLPEDERGSETLPVAGSANTRLVRGAKSAIAIHAGSARAR
jgi:DNA-binding NtrC family response regulator